MKKFTLLIIAALSISFAFGQIASTKEGRTGDLKNTGTQEEISADGDFSNTTLIGRWDNGSGTSLAVTISGNYAYVADGSAGLRIIDISTPSTPVEVGYFTTERVVYEVVVAGNYAYLAAEDNGLRIIDISTPSTPVEVGYLDTGGIANGVAISGNYAYVADGVPGLRIIDVSTPSTPVEVGSIDMDYANKVVINGNYAYVSDYNSGLRIVDVSTPSSPVEIGYYNSQGLTQGIAISGNYAYLADGSPGLRIIDISTPSSPVEVNYYNTVGETTWGIAVSGDYAYLANGTRGLRIIDISTPSVPAEVAYYDTEDEARGMAVSGNYAYVANYSNGLYIISNDLVTASTASTLNGKVTNALDGTPIAGALVEIGTYSATTDAEGNYELADIPAAELNAAFSGTPLTGTAPLEVSFTDQSNSAAYTLVVSATGFSTYTNSQVVISAGETLTMDVSLSPTLASGETRIVLNWGSTPYDIDSYLKTPDINGSTYTIYYGSKGSSSSAPFVTLDHDDRDGYGPETITIYQMSAGTYKYYVHNYSGSPDIVTSSAVVQVYSDAGLIKSVNIPSSGSGLYWNVLTIDGSTGNISVINEIVSSAPTAPPPSIPAKSANFKQIEILKNGMESISSWSWDFGDGTSSTEQNPTHTYSAAGTYTVALTISDGTNTKTETKTDYVTVTGPTTSTLNGKVTNALDGTPIAGALVEIGTYSATTDAEGNYELADIPAAELNAAFSGTPLTGTAPLEVSFTDQSNSAAYTLVVSATGFSTYTNSQVVISAGETLTMDVSLSPTLASGETRIVLNWGSTPYDIDSYLKTPDINGSTYTIYYGSKGSSSSAPFVTLDHDDRDGYGPETITIYQMSAGTYKYYVHNYSGSPDIVTSSAVVQVYSDAGLIKSVNIPSSGSGLYWNVLTIDGSTGNISVINEIVSSAPTASPPSIPAKSANFKQIEILKNGMESISSWSWDFGDGTTSTEQNPTHTYSAAGTYTVALTVSDGTNTKTETKTDYVTVAASSGDGDIILEENFDTETFPPSGWTQTITNTTKTWSLGNLTSELFTDIDPTNVYSALCGYIAEDQDEWLKSPVFALPDGIFTLEFYAGHSTAWLSAATLKLHISVDGGSNWTKIWEADNDGQDWNWRKITLDLSAYANHSNVMLGWQYVGNDGDWVGIDNVLLVQGTTAIEELEIPKAFRLAQNYPNPFKNQTTISFQLDKPEHTQLVIYNSLGQKIAEPYNGRLNAGEHQYIFNAKDLKSGIYYYRLIVDGVSTIKPMLLSN